MKIKTLTITNFRSIKDTLKITTPQMCAFIGANNSGKSNIVNAIHKVLGRDWVTVNTFDEDDVYLGEYERDISIEIEFDEPFLYYAFKGVDPSEISKITFSYTRYKVGEFKGQRRLEKNCFTKDNKPVMVLAERPKSGEKRKYRPLTTIPQEMQEAIPVIYIGTDRNLKNQLPNARNSILGNLLKDINTDFERDDNITEVQIDKEITMEVSRKQRFDDCIAEAVKMLRTEEFLKLEKQIKENALHQLGFTQTEKDNLDIYFNPLSSLEFYKSLEIWVKEHNYNINATELGSGFQNAIVISIVKAFEERKKMGAIFLIEEPEMFLHPQMQRSLYKTLVKIAETNQVIYVTHSANFVTIPNFDQIRLVSKGSDGTTVKESSLNVYPKLKEKFRKELDPERNELFFARRIFIVEGDTEKLALPEYGKRLNFDFDKVGASIIEVSGKRNIIDFVELALSFDIPVAFTFDIDSSDFQGKREEEQIFNQKLMKYSEKGVQVWSFAKNFEEELRKEWGEKSYNEYTAKFEKSSKAIKGRLLAADDQIPIPKFVIPIVNWIGKS